MHTIIVAVVENTGFNCRGVSPIPLFQDAGYYTCNGSGVSGLDRTTQKLANGKKQNGKTDYNFDWAPKMYDSHDWAGRKEGQPFFMQVQLHGGKLRGASEVHYIRFDTQVSKLFPKPLTPASVKLPPYYPRDPVLLKDWSTYLDSVRVTDHHVGLVMKRLKDEGLLQNTLVAFFTDHGISHARGKQILYDEGTHIPIVLRGPNTSEPFQDLIEHRHCCAFTIIYRIYLRRWKVEIFYLGTMSLERRSLPHRIAVEAVTVRSVRTDKYLYIRNFFQKHPSM